ncbi:MAG: type II toxin-antitoxin system HicB family antitoxin [Acidobacteria bacterium]|nr:type II toxin-antitoxin system HicB family antitoxin [Acidobacteriota bacterium]
MSKTYTVNLEAKLPVEVKRAGKWYIAACPLLDVCSQGATRKKALENLEEALYLFFRSCFERGTLTRVLKESGFVPTKTPGRTPRNTIRVPIPFQVPAAACHA